jgi:hypothetical protein
MKIKEETLNTINSDIMNSPDGWKAVVDPSIAKAAWDILMKSEITLIEFYYLRETNREEILNGMHFKIKAHLNYFFKYWKPFHKTTMETFPNSKTKKDIKIQKIEINSQEPKIRKDFGKAKFPVYRKNVWNFVKEMNSFMMVEQVLLQEQKAVFLKSLPVNSLIEFSKVENLLTTEKWEIEKHGETIFKVLEPTNHLK